MPSKALLLNSILLSLKENCSNIIALEATFEHWKLRHSFESNHPRLHISFTLLSVYRSNAMVGLAAKDLNKNGAIYYLLPLAHSANFYLFDRRNMKKIITFLSSWPRRKTLDPKVVTFMLLFSWLKDVFIKSLSLPSQRTPVRDWGREPISLIVN